MRAEAKELVERLRYSATLLGSQMDGNGGTPTPGVLEIVKSTERDLIALLSEADARRERLEAVAKAARIMLAEGPYEAERIRLKAALAALDAQAGPTEGDADGK